MSWLWAIRIIHTSGYEQSQTKRKVIDIRRVSEKMTGKLSTESAVVAAVTAGREHCTKEDHMLSVYYRPIECILYRPPAVSNYSYVISVKTTL